MDFDANIILRKLEIKKLRDVRLFFHHNFHIGGSSWLPLWQIACAHSEQELQHPMELLHWAMAHAYPSGVLAEQIHPLTGAPMLVSPLTCSYATFVTTFCLWEQRYQRLTDRRLTIDRRYSLRRHGTNPNGKEVGTDGQRLLPVLQEPGITAARTSDNPYRHAGFGTLLRAP